MARRYGDSSTTQVSGQWPSGTAFAFGTGTINIGELDLQQVSTLQVVWKSLEGGSDGQGAGFYKPVNIPEGFHCIGYYSQPNSVTKPGNAVVVRRNSGSSAVANPVDFKLVWSSQSWDGKQSGLGFFWLPVAPQGYSPLGYLVTQTQDKPGLDQVVCARNDLTAEAALDQPIWSTDNNKLPFYSWILKPLNIGTECSGISTGMFFVSNRLSTGTNIPIAVLANTNFRYEAMPSLDQIHALANQYGPTLYFHPDEAYFPSSVDWFFEAGALLYSNASADPVKIDADGSNLPQGGTNDGQYWIDLPNVDSADTIKRGKLSVAKTYLHVKPMYGATITDLAFWIFCPFNGPGTAKVGIVNVHLGKIGQHVGDWEHFTLRFNNFNAELLGVYYSQHSGGIWLRPSEIEYVNNKPIVYSSKHGHASYPHEGDNLQGDAKRGVGIRNDTSRSDFFMETSSKYEIISAEYLHKLGVEEAPPEPPWLQYMREWGPKIQYNSRTEINKVVKFLPKKVRESLEDLLNKFPNELSGEEGPTGPKEKNNWFGDERSRPSVGIS